MRLAFYGSSLLSCYWNGAATYYRGLLRALAGCGWTIHFFEPDAFDRQAHRDIDPPDWAQVTVYPATEAGLAAALAGARPADVVVKASGVGVFDDALVEGVLRAAQPDAIRAFWDVDAPATLASLEAGGEKVLAAALPRFDLVFTYGGGPPVVARYTARGAASCEPIYNALDPDTHFPVPPEASLACDLVLIANRLPDRERRIEEYFFAPAQQSPGRRFALGGAGWDDKPLPPNMRWLGHVPTARHNALNASAMAVLNVARDSMAAVGFSPATRVFEAAGAAACLITDQWEGIAEFFAPGTEILVAENGAAVASLLAALTPDRARAIGAAMRRRALADHTYAQRARRVDAVLREAIARKRHRRVA